MKKALHDIDGRGARQDKKAGVPGTPADTLEDTAINRQAVAELEPLQLIQACKAITLGFLVPGIIHDINNPTNYINLNSEILTEVWKDVMPILEQHYQQTGDFQLGGVSYIKFKDKLIKYIEDIAKGSALIKEEMSLLQRFSQSSSPGNLSKINIMNVVNSAVKLISYPVKKFTRRFFVESEENIPFLRGSFKQLELMVVNLLLNSIQAMQTAEDRITLSLSTDEGRKHILIKVEDEGAGISAENLLNVRQPFFTTKRVHGNMGIGLAVCAEIVKQHRGEMHIDSRLGKGTTVTVTLPSLMSASTAVPREGTEGTEGILV